MYMYTFQIMFTNFQYIQPILGLSVTRIIARMIPCNQIHFNDIEYSLLSIWETV